MEDETLPGDSTLVEGPGVADFLAFFLADVVTFGVRFALGLVFGMVDGGVERGWKESLLGTKTLQVNVVSAVGG